MMLEPLLSCLSWYRNQRSHLPPNIDAELSDVPKTPVFLGTFPTQSIEYGTDVNL
jgi:hypothetical protein